MTVITTSTAATATAYSNQRKVDRCQNGVLWAFSLTAGNNISPRYSTDNGATWTADTGIGNASAVSYTMNFSVFIDLDDYAHLVYKDHYNGYIYYRRGTPNAARTAWTWSAAVVVWSLTTSANAPDVVAHRQGTGWTAHVVLSVNDSSNGTRTYWYPLTIASDGAITVGTSATLYYEGTNRYITFPSIDFNHTGDGKTVAGGTPHLYAAWSAGVAGAGRGIRFKKATYSAGSWTWGAEREIDSTRYINGTGTWMQCLFDGARVILPGFVFDGSGYDLILHERNTADTGGSLRTLIDNSNTTDQRNWRGSASYDKDGNVYFIARQNDDSAAAHPLVSRKWTRSSAALAAATQVDSSATAAYASAKRGYSNGRIEFVYTDGAASPYNVTYGAITLNAPPNAPTLTAPINSVVIDKDSSQEFSWIFNDPDSGDVQSAYELQYRVTGTSTWTIVSGGVSTNHTFAAGTFSAADYEWQVRTWDNAGVIGPWSSSGLFKAATTPAAPTISDPANNGTINSNPYDVKWTTSKQDAVQVRTVADNAGTPNTATIYYESIVIEEPTRRVLSVPFNTNNRTEHVQVRVRSSGLWSSWASVLVNVSYTESQPGNLTVTPEPQNGRVKVEFTPPTPAAGEPTIVDNDLTRKINGTVEYIAIARKLGSTFTYFDYNVEGGVKWEYQVISYADNNTTVYSVPVVITPFQLKGSWLHVANDGPNTATQLIYNDNAGDEDYEIAKSVFHTADNSAPFIEFGENVDHSLTVRFFIPSDMIPYFKWIMRWGKVLCYRDFYGRKVFCVPEASPIQRTFDGGYSTVKFTEVYYEEAR